MTRVESLAASRRRCPGTSGEIEISASAPGACPLETQPWRCPFCRMYTGVRLFRIPVCPICRDQVQDFVWVSGVQASLVAVGFISGLQFAVEELLLFGVLVIVKHRLPSIFDRFVQRA